jgi:penicillin-binding protein 1B
MFRPRLKTILLLFTILLTLFIIGLAGAFWHFDGEMTQKMAQKQFLQPTMFYAYPVTFKKNDLWTADDIEKEFVRNNYRSRAPSQVLLAGDFFRGDHLRCSEKTQKSLPDEVETCFAYVRKNSKPEEVQWIFLSSHGISDLWSPQGAVPELQLEPFLMAQYLDNEPLLQRTVEISDIPVNCMNAVMAIEDQNFLDHNGFSVTSFLRAIYKNVILRQKAQGGSTITQQLVKNYFLSNEKTYKRKIEELIMSILLEARFTKDQILETYLNIIYMGQSGAFRVHGFGASAEYYFQKDLKDLELHECALLAAVLNSPGLYNPWKKPENASKRRQLVLSKMRDLNFISPEEMEEANRRPLTHAAPTAQAQETAPYYIDAVRKFLGKNNLPLQGVKVFTAIDLQAQQTAQESLQLHLAELEKNNKLIKANKDKGLTLEGAVLSGDAESGLVHVLVGGRNFRKTQFNRAIEGHRQVGSIMKPFVYLTAAQSTKDGKPYLPTSPILDEKFTIKYEGQTWSPENYGKKYYGTVPLFFALKNSLNAAAARVGMEVGLEKIIANAHELGIESQLKPFPAITLGAFEIYPSEVLRSYMALSQMGRKPDLSYVLRVQDLQDNLLYEFEPHSVEYHDPDAIGVVVGMMKQTVQTGTAKAVKASGFLQPAAGKTGTTSDYRDSWFAGFTPRMTTVVWVGYDQGEKTGLTGASGPVPIWIDTMKVLASRQPPLDFIWPENTEKIEFSPAELKNMNAVENADDASPVELIFKKGTR